MANLGTVADIKAEVLSRLNQKDFGALPYLVTLSEVMSWMNLAYFLLCRELAILKDMYSLALNTTWQEYTLFGSTAHDIIGIRFITVGDGSPLDDTTKQLIITENPTSWKTNIGTPEKFYIEDNINFLIGFDKTPNTPATAQIYYIYRPDVLTNNIDILVTPHEMNITIVEYIYYFSCLKRGDEWAQVLVANGTPAPAFWNFIKKSKQLLVITDKRTHKFLPAHREVNIYKP